VWQKHFTNKNSEERFNPSNIITERDIGSNPQEVDHPLFHSNLTVSINRQIISNKKEHMVLIKSMKFKIVLLRNPSHDTLLLESLPALFCNALNASYSHLVIAIVLLTHIHSS